MGERRHPVNEWERDAICREPQPCTMCELPTCSLCSAMHPPSTCCLWRRKLAWPRRCPLAHYAWLSRRLEHRKEGKCLVGEKLPCGRIRRCGACMCGPTCKAHGAPPRPAPTLACQCASQLTACSRSQDTRNTGQSKTNGGSPRPTPILVSASAPTKVARPSGKLWMKRARAVSRPAGRGVEEDAAGMWGSKRRQAAELR